MDLQFRSTVFDGRADLSAADCTDATVDLALAVFPEGTQTSFLGAKMTRNSAVALPPALKEHVVIVDRS